LEHASTRPERRDGGFDVVDLPAHLSMAAGSGSRGLEQGEVAATAAVAKASGPFLDRFQPQLLGIEASRPIEILRGQSRRSVMPCKHRQPSCPHALACGSFPVINSFYALRFEIIGCPATRSFHSSAGPGVSAATSMFVSSRPATPPSSSAGL